MSKSSILRYGAIAMASVGLVGVAAASTGSITGPTGQDSQNHVTLNGGTTVKSSNSNMTGVFSVNGQGASSGRVEAERNTSVGGNVSSGAATNNSNTGTTVTISNTSSALSGLGLGSNGNDSATISGATGQHSNNTVTVNSGDNVTMHNTNTTFVGSMNFQGASSGSVEAERNTTVGGVSSGAASNTNTTTTSVSVSN